MAIGVIADAMAHTCFSSHPYAGQHAAIATMHGKETVIAPILEQAFGMRLTVASGINTDALGTFSGEIAREGTMLDAARAKAQLALARTKAQFGLGSEGAFGPDPLVPFLASGLEILLLLERKSGHEIVVHRRTPTNFDHAIVAPGDDLAPFLNRIGFPEHAVIVRPEHHDDGKLVAKGLTELEAVERAVADMAGQSQSGKALVQTDMRAHLNPTRMKGIKRTARWLALNIARLCPACGVPGFGLVDVERGIPCSLCALPTRLIRAEIHGCKACHHHLKKRIRDGTLRADATWCDNCNP